MCQWRLGLRRLDAAFDIVLGLCGPAALVIVLAVILWMCQSHLGLRRLDAAFDIVLGLCGPAALVIVLAVILWMCQWRLGLRRLDAAFDIVLGLCGPAALVIVLAAILRRRRAAAVQGASRIFSYSGRQPANWIDGNSRPGVAASPGPLAPAICFIFQPETADKRCGEVSGDRRGGR